MGRIVVVVVMTVSPMPVVHENMHQGAGKQQQQWQGADDVCQMFRQQKIARNASDDDQPDRVTGTPKAGWSFMPRVVMVHGGMPLIW
jgi:hypothetical protein